MTTLEKIKSLEYRENGVVYTPTNLADFVAKQVIRFWSEDILRKSSDKDFTLSNLKIIDPACGEGELLLASARALGNTLGANENSKIDPSNELYESLVYLNERTSPRDVILSHEKYGIYINSIAKRKNFVDINYAYAPRLDLRLFYLNKLFYSRDLTKVLSIFNEFKISHILITPEMKNGLVWNKNNEGLLYLLNTNPNHFNLIYNENSFEIWRVL